MTIDPDVRALLDQLGPPSPVPAEDLTADELRQGARQAIAAFTRGADPIPVDDVVDVLVQGRAGNIPVRIYSPGTPTAVLVFLHGGGWTTGGIETSDLVTRRLCRDTGAVVVSVDYRMLPENPFPAPFDDSYDAAVWAGALHPELPFLVAGDSAGGTLAACIALKARDDRGPRIDAQVLIYPGIDDDVDRPDVRALADTSRITLEDLRFLLRQYGSQGSEYALPGRAKDLTGLPPAVMVVAGNDLLRPSNEDYARRLLEAGVAVTIQFDPELVHGWIDFAPRVPSADRAFTRLTTTVSSLIRRGAGLRMEG
ncbi:alpha/beta hydrolase [Cryptosporangium sp. NPDC051539]|uniref:alpha/beta hydrolase n=1 Tax=Cryptosporangium sp. NPDC051539 TaxID=3363962 RepID=UPI003799404B